MPFPFFPSSTPSLRPKVLPLQSNIEAALIAAGADVAVQVEQRGALDGLDPAELLSVATKVGGGITTGTRASQRGAPSSCPLLTRCVRTADCILFRTACLQRVAHAFLLCTTAQPTIRRPYTPAPALTAPAPAPAPAPALTAPAPTPAITQSRNHAHAHPSSV